MRGARLLATMAMLAAATEAMAADQIADPTSRIGIVGQMIIDTAAGQSYEDAFASSKSADNPYRLPSGPLAVAAGVDRVSDDLGAPVKAGELSILPQFSTPGGKFAPSAETPPTIPFAFLADGKCQAGYVAGFPAPDKTYVVDLKDAPCSAHEVDQRNLKAYTEVADAAANTPRDLSDAELETLVRTASTAASGFARTNGNYFARDGDFAPLRKAVATAVSKAGFTPVVVPERAAADPDAAKTCLTAPGTELRLATNTFGDGVSLVAVTEARMFAYRYDPHESAEIIVTPASDCV